MIRTVASKVMWVGRATVFVVGLAVILALTVGVVSTALAGTGVGSAFNLGKTNTVSAISKLVGSVAGPSLLIDNNSTNSAATALDLQVEAGKAPMKVNRTTKVTNLNADKLDGMDAGQLQGFSTIQVRTIEVSHAPGTFTETASCQAGEQAISGSVELTNGNLKEISYTSPGGIPVVDSTTGKITGWRTTYLSSFDTVVRVYAVCVS